MTETTALRLCTNPNESSAHQPAVAHLLDELTRLEWLANQTGLRHTAARIAVLRGLIDHLMTPVRSPEGQPAASPSRKAADHQGPLSSSEHSLPSAPAFAPS